MGAALHKALFPNEESKVALLNIGSEELKGNSVIKNTYQILNEKNLKTALTYKKSGILPKDLDKVLNNHLKHLK